MTPNNDDALVEAKAQELLDGYNLRRGFNTMPLLSQIPRGQAQDWLIRARAALTAHRTYKGK